MQTPFWYCSALSKIVQCPNLFVIHGTNAYSTQEQLASVSCRKFPLIAGGTGGTGFTGLTGEGQLAVTHAIELP